MLFYIDLQKGSNVICLSRDSKGPSRDPSQWRVISVSETQEGSLISSIWEASCFPRESFADWMQKVWCEKQNLV